MLFKREISFVFLFSTLLSAGYWLIRWFDNGPLTLPEELLIFPLSFVGFAGLRLLTRIVEHVQARGGRWLGWLIGNYLNMNGGEGERPNDAPIEPQPYTQMLVNLVFVGGTIALGIAAVPFVGMFLTMSLFGEVPEDNRWVNGFFLTVGSVLTYAWLKLLERTTDLKIRLPLIPVNAVWLMPVIFVAGLVWFAFPGVFLEANGG